MPNPKKKLKTLKPKHVIARQKKSAANLGEEASKHVDRHLVNRLQSLAHSWRFIFSWVLLSVLLVWVLAIQIRGLDRFYTRTVTQSGGTYIEGVVGPLNNMNPIFASSNADQSVSRLLFSGLMKYDNQNMLVNDLAESIESDEKASQFTVTLRDDIFWHDGRKLTADDVAFTVNTIKQPDARSPLLRSWQGVGVDAVSERTIVFNLPGSFSPFPTLLTFGILPKHILGEFSPSQLRSAQFNSSQPVGSGPFKFQRIVSVSGGAESDQEFKVQLVANEDYYAGPPRLDAFTFWIAPDSDRLSDLYNDGQLSGSSDIIASQTDLQELNAQESKFNLTSAAYAFFKTTNPTLEDKDTRVALAQAIHVGDAIKALPEPATRIDGPLLPEQLGYQDDISQLEFDKQAAESSLTDLGWILGADGIRSRDGQALELLVTTQEDTDLELVATAVVEQLRAVGVDAQLDLRSKAGFAENVLRSHVYSGILVYAINIGVDPDVYSFWHSSQADENSTIRLNLSEYSSADADDGLDGGRSRVEADVRVDKYQKFLEAWVSDAPAVGLYRNNYTYYTLRGVEGPAGSILSSPLDRYRDVAQWTVLTEKIPYTWGD